MKRPAAAGTATWAVRRPSLLKEGPWSGPTAGSRLGRIDKAATPDVRCAGSLDNHGRPERRRLIPRRHRGSRTGVARIQRPGLPAASSPPRSTRTTAPPHHRTTPPRRLAALGAVGGALRGPGLRSFLFIAGRQGLRVEHRQVGVAPRVEAPLRRQTQQPRRLPAQQRRELLQGDVPRRDSRPPQARQELAVSGALLGPRC